jgi:hypothetical protein
MAALHVFDVTILGGHLVLLLLITLASYGIAFYVVRQISPAKASICAASIVALGLGAHWLWFDGTLHTDNRYYLRTVLLIATPVLGMLAAAHALRANGRLNFAIPFMRRSMAALATSAVTRLAAGGDMYSLTRSGVADFRTRTAMSVVDFGKSFPTGKS